MQLINIVKEKPNISLIKILKNKYGADKDRRKYKYGAYKNHRKNKYFAGKYCKKTNASLIKTLKI